ncbi:acetate--CoA ligase family protein [Nocardia sp. NBC_00508]|uniref:acetate--CoA ligase family protein n=1 Tax=Nocardia sp. NBC_00508 TaxID=2975992 RepID=UPI002E81CACE|nr:acetate--CoA ligase family protein [Nocardia sp. NBC_00508]WUD66006.1 acetate--CoA ligase family protein [Nocardia sp. NBC_00508]
MPTLDAPVRTALERLLDPRSIVIVGASNNSAKRGYQAIRALQETGYAHPIYPVNPNTRQILGLEVCSSIDRVPHGADVALIAVPAAAVPGALRECAAVGIAGAVVLANGFGEIGEDGADLAAALAAAIDETGIRVIGPNTSGLLNVTSGANLVGLRDIRPGPISVITQSGNMLLSLVNDDHAVKGPGFYAYVGLGNQADVRYDECLTELARHPGTGVVAIHSEGFTDGRAFLVAAAGTVPDTPVVLLRGGRSEVGRRAAASHTGSIAGSDAVAAAVLRQAGVELVDRSDELAIVAGALATCAPVAPGRSVAILSDGGGHAALAADALAAHGIESARLGERTRRQLRRLLGGAAAVSGPVDVAGATDADPMVFVEAAEILMRDPAVGLVLIIGLYGGYHLRFDPLLRESEDAAAGSLLALSAEYGVPLLVQSCYAGLDIANHDRLRAGGVPVLGSIEHAVRAAAALQRRGRLVADRARRSSLMLPPSAPPIPGSGILDEPTARWVLAEAKVDVGVWTFARSVDAVAAAVASYRRPCALKVVSPQVIHKSDVGGVRLGVVASTATEHAEAIIDSVTAEVPDARIDGMIVTPMADTGVELFVGATRDPIFGPVLAFGTGGVLVEAVRDVTFRAVPLTEPEAREMIEETIASRMLDGYRHFPAVDRDSLARFLVRIGDFVAAHPEISELDLNPVIASGSGITPVDVRIVLSEKTSGGRDE